MNLDHPNKDEQRMKETLHQHEFPFDPLAWQDMKTKLANSSSESTPDIGQHTTDNDRPPGISFISIILLIMTTISVFSIALWYGLSNPVIPTTETTVGNDPNIYSNLYTANEIGVKDETASRETVTAFFPINTSGDLKENENKPEENGWSKKNVATTQLIGSAQKIGQAEGAKRPLGKEKTNESPEGIQSTDEPAPGDNPINANELGAFDIPNALAQNNAQGEDASHTSAPLRSESIELGKAGASGGSENLVLIPTLSLAFVESMGSDTAANPVLLPTPIQPIKWSGADLKFGIGHGFMGTGDNSMLMFQSEITKKFHRLFSAAFSLNYGVKYSGLSESVSIVATDLNFFVSPFGNQGKNNFKIGTGGSFLYVDDVVCAGSRFENGVVIKEFDFDKRKTLGFNVILEHEILLGEKYLMGFHARYHQYFSGDLNTALMLKFGVRL